MAKPRVLLHAPGVLETPGAFVIRFPFTGPLLRPNERPHWTRRSRDMKAVREESARLASRGKIPHIDQCRITARWLVADKRKRDGNSLALFIKAAIDGLVDAGVLTDDHHLIVTRESQEIVSTTGWGLELEIEVTA